MASCLLIIITTFTDILLNTSPIPKGLELGFLLRGINLHATKLSKDAQSLLFDIFVIHNFLTSSAIALRRSDAAVSNHDETIILVITAAFLLALRQCHHTQLEAFFVLVLVVTHVGTCLLHQDVLTLIIEEFHLSEVKYHHSYYWLIS